LGAGRVVWQDLARISRSISDQTFFANKTLLDLLSYVKNNNKKLHLLGLVSDGGVHSHIDHLLAFVQAIKNSKIQSAFIHMITDGRDSPPKNALTYLEKLENSLANSEIKIASVSGRYYAMDRDKHWERTERAYRVIVEGIGEKSQSAKDALQQAYSKNETDEFISPTAICNSQNNPLVKVEDGDGIIFFNFRADRMRQITTAILKPDFKDFKREIIPKNLKAVTMTSYEENKKLPVQVLFPPVNLKNTLAEVISNNNLHQLHIAETEKYAHVTYFFNGGREEPFPNEDRILVPSPRVATYDLKPEMSAHEITKKLIPNLKNYDFIVVNFANPDMVGHTGNMDAAIKAVETVDKCLGEIIPKALGLDKTIIITADHGNVEQLIDPDKKIDKEHTINPVPLILIQKNNKLATENNITNFLNQSPIGILADVAPTILDIMGIEKPTEMTGQSLARSL